MAQQPSDMRMGVNRFAGQVRSVRLDPTDSSVYIFVGLSRKVMKILHWEYGGYVIYYKRLEEGRFHPKIFLRQGVGFRSMRWSELVLLMEGISPKVARRHRYDNGGDRLDNNCRNVQKNLQNSDPKFGYIAYIMYFSDIKAVPAYNDLLSKITALEELHKISGLIPEIGWVAR